MSSLQELVEAQVEIHGTKLEEALLGTGDPGEIARTIETAVAEALGPVSSSQFYARSVGLVAGVEVSGQVVVVKVRDWRVSEEHLRAVNKIQRSVALAGVPSPLPLISPRKIGHAWLTIEEYLPGEVEDARKDAVRESMAGALQSLIRAAESHSVDAGIGTALIMCPRDGLWLEPHDARFDFEGTRVGAEWIDYGASRALEVLDGLKLPSVVGHLDWRVENMGFRNERVVAIYDWDSIGVAPECVIVGSAAASFTTDWRTTGCHVPSYEEGLEFASDYLKNRGRDFSRDERSAFEAARLWTYSYGARCQHSDFRLGLVSGNENDLPWIAGLRSYFAALN